MTWKDLLDHETLITVVLVILLIGVLFYGYNTTKQEYYSNLSPANYPQPNSFKPAYYEPELGILTSSSDFIGMPTEIIPAWTDDINIPKTTQKLGNMGLGYSLCSKSCCTPQYLPPFSVPQDDIVKKSGKKFIHTSYACSNTWQDSGCLCMTEEQGNFLDSRGGNK